MPKLPPKGDRPRPRRTLGMDERPPMKKHRRGILREWPATHAWSDGEGRVWTHQGTGAECREAACVAWRREQRRAAHRVLADFDPQDPDGPGEPATPRPWGYSDEHVESWTEDPRPDPLGPCPVYGKHRWQWADDGNGHSGDVCKCGAFEE